MKLLTSFSEFVVEYESEKEYQFNRPNFTLDGYEVTKVDRKSENQIIVTYQKHENEEIKIDN